MEGSESAASIGAVDVMASSGGPHPPALWAEITTAQILQVASTAAEPAHELKARVIAVLERFHRQVQEDERSALIEHGIDRPLDPSPYIMPTIGALTEAVEPLFKAHFDQANVKDYLRNLLGQHFATVIDIERKWYIARR